MGLFDFFRSKGPSNDDKSVQKHAERVLDKRSMSPDRFAAIEYLCKLGNEEAWRALLPRYNFTVDPLSTDREEKQYIYESLTGSPEAALEPVKEFLRTAPAVTWPAKMLKAICPEEYVTELLDVLSTFDRGYSKTAERKQQLLMALEQERDERIGPAVLPFVEDFAEDVRFHAVRTVCAQDYPVAVETLVKQLLREESARIRVTIVDGLTERAWACPEELRSELQRLLPSLPTGSFSLKADGVLTKAAR